jgi:hypothetical protein
MSKEPSLSPQQVARAKFLNSATYRTKIKKMIQRAKAIQPTGELTPRQKMAVHYFAAVLVDDSPRRSASRNTNTDNSDAPPADSVKY